MDNGRVVGSLEVPRQLIDSVREEEIILSIYTMTVDRFERGINGGQRIRSVVSDITLRSNLSEELITDLNESLTICLEAGEESGVRISLSTLSLGLFSHGRIEGSMPWLLSRGEGQMGMRRSMP